MSESIGNEDLSLLPEEVAAPVVRELPQTDKEWPEYREHVGRIRCVICQHTRGQDQDGNQIDEFSTRPELIRVSDAHHLTTKGAGGPDAENLVPLCRVHHNEFHAMGVDSFQLHYNFDLRRAALIIFDHFMQTFDAAEYAQIVHAKHQRILTRVFNWKREARDIGELMLEFRTSRVGDRRPYEWIGFDRFDSWVTSPITAGGLGMSMRTAWRYQNMAKIYRMFPGREDELDKINGAKANAVIKLLENSDDEQKEEIIHHAINSTTEDLISWKNKKEGKPDPKEMAKQQCESVLFEFLNAHGIYEIDEQQLQSWAHRVLVAVDERRYT